jgi:hypothetical protein
VTITADAEPLPGAPAQAADRSALEVLLDNLGQAHSRPFSRN